jgi:hypothetical protein
MDSKKEGWLSKTHSQSEAFLLDAPSAWIIAIILSHAFILLESIRTLAHLSYRFVEKRCGTFEHNVCERHTNENVDQCRCEIHFEDICDIGAIACSCPGFVTCEIDREDMAENQEDEEHWEDVLQDEL